MTAKDNISRNVEALVQNALKYQLITEGAFIIYNKTRENELSNSSLEEFGIKHIASERLNFDGGIQLNLIAIGALGKSMMQISNQNSITASIYNLENTDGEFDLEEYHINELDDCERISASVDFHNMTNESIEELDTAINTYITSDKLSSLATFIALNS